MRTWISIICAGVLALAGALSASAQSIYDFKVKAQDGSEVSLADYKGKVLLIVNTATQCGFTPQYKELEALYRKFQDKGLVILDFPCNQFGEQAPGTDAEIHAFCTGQYAISFPQFAKVQVNGPEAEPLFTWLKSQQGFKGFGGGTKAQAMDKLLSQQDPDYANNPDIKWNFTKFLVDREGNVAARFEPTQSMKFVEAVVGSKLF